LSLIYPQFICSNFEFKALVLLLAILLNSNLVYGFVDNFSNVKAAFEFKLQGFA